MKNKINKTLKILGKDTHFKELLSGSAVSFVLKISGMLLGYIVIYIVANYYGAEGIGIYTLSINIITFFAMLGAIGLNTSILRYVGQFKSRLNGNSDTVKKVFIYAVQIVFPIATLLGLIVFFCADFIAIRLLGNAIYATALKLGIILIPVMSLMMLSVEFIRGLKKIKISELLRSISRPLVNICLLLTVVFFSTDLLTPVYTASVSIIISTLVAIFFVRRELVLFHSHDGQDISRKELVITSIPMMWTSLITFIMSNVSLFLLEVFATSHDVGVFAVAAKLAALVTLVITVVNTISAPKFSELYWKHDLLTLQSIVLKSTKMIFFVSVASALLMIAFAQPFMNLFGNGFSDGYWALLILILGQLINAASGSVAILLNMTGHQVLLRNISLIAMLLTLVLSVFLIKKIGITGAAIGLSLGMVLKNITAAYYVKKLLGLTTYYIPTIKAKNTA